MSSFLVASKNYQAGEVIYETEPFVRVIRHDLWDKICANCLRSDSHLKMCGACGIMKYCGKLCQKKAWKNHKWECPYLRNYTDRREQEDVQMIGNIILKINGRNWKTITERVLDNEVGFDDLVSHTDGMPETSLIVQFLKIKDPLTAYIGKENIPDDRTILKLLGKAVYNRFSFVRDDSNSERKDGCCFFIGASKFDHSCVPNSAIKINGISIEFRAIKPIHKSEKISIGYRSMIDDINSFIELERLKRSFGRDCYCSDCSQPYGQSDLTKMEDMSKALPLLEDTKEDLELIYLHYPLTLISVTLEFVFYQKLKQMLRDQKGVLGSTNLYRMRTLALCFLFMDGPKREMRNGLKLLEKAMVEVWGENYPELICVYKKLIKVNMSLCNRQEAFMYAKKICRLRAVSFGTVYLDEDFYANLLCDTLHLNIFA